MSATLASLRIRNLALVEDLTWDLDPGFTAITGETGAGKSVILGAITLLLGERADKSLIRTGADSCTVEATFSGVTESSIAALLDTHGTEPCDQGQLLLKRTLPATGTGRQFANGSPCTLALLRALGDVLVDLHGPHDHQSLFSREQQTRLLDRFASNEELRRAFSEGRRALLRLREEQAAITSGEEAAARELDLLSHQTKEIATADLQPGEEEHLIARQLTASNHQRISELSAALAAAVSEEEDALISRIGQVSRLSRELARLDPDAQAVADATESAFAATDDLARRILSHSASIETDPWQLSTIAARLDTIQDLKRKYGSSIDAILAFHAEAAEKLAALRDRDERRGSLEGDIQAAEKSLAALGKKLTTRREAAAGKLAAKVRTGLKDLGFAKFEFSVVLEPHEDAVAHGNETAEFEFAPNPGEPTHPLRAIASSGEISRVMLALKSALADEDEVPVLIFDEIDANVGGEIAARVGLAMKALGCNRQVLCITHLPQVAAAATTQFVVTKDVRDNRTRTHLNQTKGQSREEEIARMLGGKTASALAHARTLLKGG